MKQKPYLMMALGLIDGPGVGILGTYYMVNRNNVEELITSQQARDIVMNKVPGSTIQEFLYDNEDGVAIYESLLQKALRAQPCSTNPSDLPSRIVWILPLCRKALCPPRTFR